MGFLVLGSLVSQLSQGTNDEINVTLDIVKAFELYSMLKNHCFELCYLISQRKGDEGSYWCEAPTSYQSESVRTHTHT